MRSSICGCAYMECALEKLRGVDDKLIRDSIYWMDVEDYSLKIWLWKLRRSMVIEAIRRIVGYDVPIVLYLLILRDLNHLLSYDGVGSFVEALSLQVVAYGLNWQTEVELVRQSTS